MRFILPVTVAILALVLSLGCPPDPDDPDNALHIFVRVYRELPASGECHLDDLEESPPVAVRFSHPNPNVLLEGCTPHTSKATGQVNEDNEAEFTLNLEGPELVYTDLQNGFCATEFGAFCIAALGPPTGYTVRLENTPEGIWDVSCSEADDDFDAFGNTRIADVTYDVNGSCAGPG